MYLAPDFVLSVISGGLSTAGVAETGPPPANCHFTYKLPADSGLIFFSDDWNRALVLSLPPESQSAPQDAAMALAATTVISAPDTAIILFNM